MSTDREKRCELVNAVLARMNINDRVKATPGQVYATLRSICEQRGAYLWFIGVLYMDWIEIIRQCIALMWYDSLIPPEGARDEYADTH